MKKTLLFLSVLAITLSQAQVSLVKEINPGIANGTLASTNGKIAAFNKLLFSANDGTNGFELWESDGTAAGTVLLKDIDAGNNSGNPKDFFYWPQTNEVYFAASDVFSSGTNFDLYQTDGTSSGTSILRDLNWVGSSNPIFYTEFQNKLYFQARYVQSNYNAEWEMCVTDGFTAGLFIDLWTGTFNSSSPAQFTVFNGKLYFVATTSVEGRELWRTDGTVAGTQLVQDLNAGGGSSSPFDLTIYNNALYFSAFVPSLGREIFKMSTNENITSLKNINAGAANGNPEQLKVFNGKLYFTADDGTNGIELWQSSGFPSNTIMLKNINALGDSSPLGFTEHGGELFFSSDDGINGTELWKTDGTLAGTVLVSNINPTGNSNPEEFTTYGANLYFRADNGTDGTELWITDGLLSGTNIITDINTNGNSNPIGLTVANNLLFFTAYDDVRGQELWTYKDATLSVSNSEFKNSISLFPNPTTNSFSIETSENISEVSIINLQGKITKSFKEKLESYSIENLSSGLYFVNIQTEKGKITKKIIKE